MKKRALKKLADYLVNLPPDYSQFNMGTFCDTGESPCDTVKAIHNCGTCGCALGHGPVAGIEAHKGEDWSDYCERAFGIDFSGSEYYWCFYDDWPDDPVDTAMRFQYLLDNGLPDGFDANDFSIFGLDCLDDLHPFIQLYREEYEVVDA